MKPIIIIICSACSLLTWACGRVDKGEVLAKRHCSTCHAFTDPSLLNKKTWGSGVFPEMAYRMGLDLSRLPITTKDELNEILKTIPPAPGVTNEEWNLIREYFVKNAPDTLTSPAVKEFLPLSQFTPSVARLPVDNGKMITMIRFDENQNNFFIGTRKGKVYRLNSSLDLLDSLQVGSPPSDMIFSKSHNQLISLMGIMDPNDKPAGSVIRLTDRKNDQQLVIDSIKRPVHIQQGDLNNDRQDDLLICAFGNFTGGLFAYEKSDGEYVRHVIHNFPGTRKAVIKDFNSDGLPDIVALVTQGNEQLALFTNRGNFKFSYTVLLKFPPVYGSSYFDISDFNGDGKPDILYTNGDNADYSTILKPYHGVRIYMNDGRNHFSESWFAPMNGASMARAADFDNDGDIDIAAISFFPDFKNHPEHSFIYFENNGANFTSQITMLASASRWITMESADVDNDEDIDLILGALIFPNGVPDSLFQTWRKNQVSLLVLKNNLR